ncbi:MAG: DUF975 family protein [Treponema sp.]|nr:DUF975 family protein [Treponema sp.]
MFDRKKYKKFARMQLQNRRTVPALMTLITKIVFLMLLLPSLKNMPALYDAALRAARTNNWLAYKEALNAYSNMPAVNLAEWLIFFAVAIFAVAQLCVYLKMSRGPEPVQLGDFFAGFSHWWRAALAMIWQWLWVFLWMLLFFIPGIVKALAYSQMFFIIAEFPNMPIRNALTISKKITRGYKANLFVMHMSFIGWQLLGFITCGIANLWITPYITMTQVNAYHALMKQALETNVITHEEIHY